MSQAADLPTSAKSNSVGGQYHFLLRRLHSLSGIAPIGIFVMFHLFTNMQMALANFGLGDFQHEVDWIHSQPALLMMEIFVLALPITFHSVLGFIYTFKNVKPNATRYPYWSNLRYTLQRVTGILAFIFILLHVCTLRGRFNLWGWFTPFFPEVWYAPEGAVGETVKLAHYSTSVALDNWLVLILYIVGVLAVVYHWSNGLWTAAITWGLTISAKAQRQWGYLCAGLFATLFLFSALAIYGALTYEPTDKEIAAYEWGKTQLAEGHNPIHKPADAGGH